MKKYLIFDLDGTLLRPHKVDIYEILIDEIAKISPEKATEASRIIRENYGIRAKNLLETLEIAPEDIKRIMNLVIGIVEELKQSCKFYEEAIEIVTKLAERFTLILSTVSSYDFANTILKRGGLHDKFRLILGSSTIQKGDDHIKKMKELMEDGDFESKAIFVGDSDKDEAIATRNNIDFIRVADGVTMDILELLK